MGYNSLYLSILEVVQKHAPGTANKILPNVLDASDEYAHDTACLNVVRQDAAQIGVASLHTPVKMAEVEVHHSTIQRTRKSQSLPDLNLPSTRPFRETICQCSDIAPRNYPFS